MCTRPARDWTHKPSIMEGKKVGNVPFSEDLEVVNKRVAEGGRDIFLHTTATRNVHMIL